MEYMMRKVEIDQLYDLKHPNQNPNSKVYKKKQNLELQEKYLYGLKCMRDFERTDSSTCTSVQVALCSLVMAQYYFEFLPVLALLRFIMQVFPPFQFDGFPCCFQQVSLVCHGLLQKSHLLFSSNFFSWLTATVPTSVDKPSIIETLREEFSETMVGSVVLSIITILLLSYLQTCEKTSSSLTPDISFEQLNHPKGMKEIE